MVEQFTTALSVKMACLRVSLKYIVFLGRNMMKKLQLLLDAIGLAVKKVEINALSFKLFLTS